MDGRLEALRIWLAGAIAAPIIAVEPAPLTHAYANPLAEQEERPHDSQSRLHDLSDPDRADRDRRNPAGNALHRRQ